MNDRNNNQIYMFSLGRAAALDGRLKDENPYKDNKDERLFEWWNDGWDFGASESDEEMNEI